MSTLLHDHRTFAPQTPPAPRLETVDVQTPRGLVEVEAVEWVPPNPFEVYKVRRSKQIAGVLSANGWTMRSALPDDGHAVYDASGAVVAEGPTPMTALQEALDAASLEDFDALYPDSIALPKPAAPEPMAGGQ